MHHLNRAIKTSMKTQTRMHTHTHTCTRTQTHTHIRTHRVLQELQLSWQLFRSFAEVDFRGLIYSYAHLSGDRRELCVCLCCLCVSVCMNVGMSVYSCVLFGFHQHQRKQNHSQSISSGFSWRTTVYVIHFRINIWSCAVNWHNHNATVTASQDLRDIHQKSSWRLESQIQVHR